MITPRSSYKNQGQTGFSLVEMAIVLTIVGVMLAGLLPTLSSQVEQRRVSETNKQMNEIKDALIGFAVINGRLPCPADGTIPTVAGVANNAGVEIASCPASANGGVLPWVTLGVSETDAWGRRFTYRVTPVFATAGTPFQLSSSPNLNVGLTPGSSNVASGVPVVIVSHGANGLGAYMPTGQQVQPVPLATTDEGDNTVNDNDNNFVSHAPVQNGYDDLVVWISPNILLNRMVTAGKLP